MLVCASIIAQPIESQGNKKVFPINMLGNYAGFALSVVAIANVFARQALAGSRQGGLVSVSESLAVRECHFRSQVDSRSHEGVQCFKGCTIAKIAGWPRVQSSLPSSDLHEQGRVYRDDSSY